MSKMEDIIKFAKEIVEEFSNSDLTDEKEKKGFDYIISQAKDEYKDSKDAVALFDSIERYCVAKATEAAAIAAYAKQRSEYFGNIEQFISCLSPEVVEAFAQSTEAEVEEAMAAYKVSEETLQEQQSVFTKTEKDGGKLFLANGYPAYLLTKLQKAGR